MEHFTNQSKQQSIGQSAAQNFLLIVATIKY